MEGKIRIEIELANKNIYNNVDFTNDEHKQALDYGESLCAKFDGKRVVWPKKLVVLKLCQ